MLTPARRAAQMKQSALVASIAGAQMMVGLTSALKHFQRRLTEHVPKYAPFVHLKCAHPQNPLHLIGITLALECSWRASYQRDHNSLKSTQFGAAGVLQNRLLEGAKFQNNQLGHTYAGSMQTTGNFRPQQACVLEPECVGGGYGCGFGCECVCVCVCVCVRAACVRDWESAVCMCASSTIHSSPWLPRRRREPTRARLSPSSCSLVIKRAYHISTTPLAQEHPHQPCLSMSFSFKQASLIPQTFGSLKLKGKWSAIPCKASGVAALIQQRKRKLKTGARRVENC
eukprot:1157673-Pelagomonas_calceolata.AAC.4